MRTQPDGKLMADFRDMLWRSLHEVEILASRALLAHLTVMENVVLKQHKAYLVNYLEDCLTEPFYNKSGIQGF